jgi:hypothetical protein
MADFTRDSDEIVTAVDDVRVNIGVTVTSLTLELTEDFSGDQEPEMDTVAAAAIIIDEGSEFSNG